MKKLLVSTIIAVFCILFYKGADAAVVFGMNENTGISNVITVTGDSPEEEIQIKNMVSVLQGQSFNLSQTSNLTESGDVNIENLQSLSGFPEDFNYNPGAVSVDGYNIKADGTGTAVLKISASGLLQYRDSKIPSNHTNSSAQTLPSENAGAYAAPDKMHGTHQTAGTNAHPRTYFLSCSLKKT